VHELLARARVLVLPSECYETFGRVAAEAYAAGTPVIAANGGSLREIVEHEETGLLFTQGSADDLVRQMRRALRAPAMVDDMRAAARAHYEEHFNAPMNLRQLMDVYRQAIAWRHDQAPSTSGRQRLTMLADASAAAGGDLHV
jgi:glycosyltransferase involved in cell wall biosynthesis